MKKRKNEDLVRDALLESALVVPISSERSYAGWEFLCRQVPGQERAWLACVEDLLRWAQTALSKSEELLIARKYLIKDDRMVYGWLLRLKAKSAQNVSNLTDSFISILKKKASSMPVAALPQSAGTVQPRTSTVTPRIKIVSKMTDEEGRLIEVTEMPLPHVRHDLNIPSKPIWSEEHGRYVGGGKGAKPTGG
jgi:hypothetical protein